MPVPVFLLAASSGFCYPPTSQMQQEIPTLGRISSQFHIKQEPSLVQAHTSSSFLCLLRRGSIPKASSNASSNAAPTVIQLKFSKWKNLSNMSVLLFQLSSEQA